MKILVAPDKFKGSLTAIEVCGAIKSGLLQTEPGHQITAIPMADGGEGTCELLTHYFSGDTVSLDITGPDFIRIKSEYGISKDGNIAFIEMAKASGLQLLKKENRNPLFTTTIGTGELIKNALDRGVKKILLGIGGSGTNDAGIGMASALGFDFFDSNKELLKPIGENLVRLQSIGTNHIDPRIKEVEFAALCDVDNPLFGPKGAAYIYAPQKGADEKAVELLDDGLRNFEAVIQRTYNTSANFPGAGAGGGLPGGAKVFLNITIHRGMDYIIKTTELESKIQKADLIITGEGRIDQQTLSGKVVMEIGKLGMKYNKKVVAVCGKCELGNSELQKIGISEVLTLIDENTSENEAIKNAFQIIEKKIISIL